MYDKFLSLINWRNECCPPRGKILFFLGSIAIGVSLFPESWQSGVKPKSRENALRKNAVGMNKDPPSSSSS